MTDECKNRFEELKEILKDTNGLVIGFSGGVDSTLLVAAAYDVLGDKCHAVTSTSSTYARRECKQAIEWIKEQGIPHTVIESEELDIPQFSDNPPDRCYHCKRELFCKIGEVGQALGLEYVADGSNADDESDYRPGRKAAKELGVLSPLLEAGMTKQDIRDVAREIYNLPVADKPAMACLASRFPYGEKITAEKLEQTQAIEEYLQDQGFKVYRARHHGSIVRIETSEDEIARLADAGTRSKLVECAKEQGFLYVTLDLQGYRTGSMNEELNLDQM
jgi:uncharacterized protein